MTLAKNFAAVTLLVFTFALTSFAGDQQTPGCPTPQLPPPQVTAAAENAEITTDVAGAIEEAQETPENLWYQALFGLLSIY